MNVLRYGRKSIITCMMLFFIGGIIGVVISNEFVVKGCFALAVISSVFIIIMTFILRGEKECKK